MRQRSWGAGRWCAALVNGGSLLLLVGCGGQAPDGVTSSEGAPSVIDVPPPLTSGAGCEALLDHLHEGLLQQVRSRAEEARVAPLVEDLGAAFRGARSSLRGPSVEAAALTSIRGPASLSGFSQTTVQVPGVDEGDLVKAEGEQIYWVHGSILRVIDAPSGGLLTVVHALPFEGEAAELLIHEGKIVLFSRLYGALPGVPQPASSSPYPSTSYTKITVLELGAGAPQVLREAYVAGDYAYSRRQGSVVRGVVQYRARIEIDAPIVSYTDVFGRPRSPEQIDRQLQAWVAVSAESIQASTLEDYVPAAFERVGDRLVERSLRCGDYLVPAPGMGEGGATSVLSLDLDSLGEPLENLTVLGYADSVHVDDDTIIVQQRNTSDWPDLRTDLHVFELDGARARFITSGSVGGMLATPSSLDQLDGVLRLATTDTHYAELPDGGLEYRGTTTLVLTLGVSPAGLGELGRTADFGEGRFIQAARFAGDRAYLTTGPAPDQLEVVDLSDPHQPTISARLAVPGEADALLPLASDQLLAFIHANTPVSFIPLLSLRLYDMKDVSAPRLAHEYLYSDYSTAGSVADARAVAFSSQGDMFAFPITSPIAVNSLEVFRLSEGAGFTRLGGALTEVVLPSLPVCLAQLSYESDPEAVALLEQDPERLAVVLEECRGRLETPYPHRGLLRGEDVFSVNNLSLTAHALDTLSAPPRSRIDFPLFVY